MRMSRLAVVDAGPLYAAADADDADDADHAESVAVLADPTLRLVVQAHILRGRRSGAKAESAFLRGLGSLDVESPDGSDFGRMAELVDEYADFPLGGTDASVIALAERLDAGTVVTLDRRHFAAVRPRHLETFELLPGS
jgi:predicted nucleic acid-binding protein